MAVRTISAMPCYATSRAPVKSLKVPGVVIGRRSACCSVPAGALPTPAVTGNICDCADGTPRVTRDAQPRSARLRQHYWYSAKHGSDGNLTNASHNVVFGVARLTLGSHALKAPPSYMQVCNRYHTIPRDVTIDVEIGLLRINSQVCGSRRHKPPPCRPYAIDTC